jgi:hypothetical protein
LRIIHRPTSPVSRASNAGFRSAALPLGYSGDVDDILDFSLPATGLLMPIKIGSIISTPPAFISSL